MDINFIEQCINKTTSKLNSKAISFKGYSSFKVRNFLNCLLEFPDSKYFEVGVWKGSTFYSALYNNNPSYAVAVDNWSEFGGSCDEFKNNIIDLECNYEIYNIDCFKIDKKIFKNKFNIYFYDGNHSVLSQEQALVFYYDVLEDTFLYICDDWNCQEVKDGTKQGILKTGLKIIKDWDLPAIANGDLKNWWNGLYVAILQKNTI